MANIRSSQIIFHLVLKISISLTTLIILIHVYIVFFKVLKKKVFGVALRQMAFCSDQHICTFALTYDVEVDQPAHLLLRADLTLVLPPVCPGHGPDTRWEVFTKKMLNFSQ